MFASLRTPGSHTAGRAAAVLVASLTAITTGLWSTPTAAGAALRPGPGTHWVTTWGGSAMAPSPLVSSVQSLSNQTIRNIVYTSVGGCALRIRVSNAFGDRPVRIATASVARQRVGAQIDPDTLRPVTFGGHRALQLAPDASTLSDPVMMPVPALSTLAVSLFLPDPTGPATYHQDARQDNYLADGDHTGDTTPDAYTTTVGTWFFVDAVQVRSVAPGAVIAFGDSITDGTKSTANANTRWPNVLARRLIDRSGVAAPAVVGEGISGNRILHDSTCFGVAAPARLERDVLSQPGVRTVVLFEGINDLGFSQVSGNDCVLPNPEVTAEQLIQGYTALAARIHSRGLRLLVGTLMPAQDSGYWSDAAEGRRLAVNTWLRTSTVFDGVIDFATLMAAPGNPALLDPRFDSGDHLHPNDAGYQVMADAVASMPL